MDSKLHEYLPKHQLMATDGFFVDDQHPRRSMLMSNSEDHGSTSVVHPASSVLVAIDGRDVTTHNHPAINKSFINDSSIIGNRYNLSFPTTASKQNGISTFIDQDRPWNNTPYYEIYDYNHTNYDQCDQCEHFQQQIHCQLSTINKNVDKSRKPSTEQERQFLLMNDNQKEESISYSTLQSKLPGQQTTPISTTTMKINTNNDIILKSSTRTTTTTTSSSSSKKANNNNGDRRRNQFKYENMVDNDKIESKHYLPSSNDEIDHSSPEQFTSTQLRFIETDGAKDAKDSSHSSPSSGLSRKSSAKHCHQDHEQDKNRNSESARQSMRKLIYGLLLCTLFMVIQLIGGYLSHSLAIFSDAAHLLSDMISFVISLVAIYIGQKRPTRTNTFGYYRMEIIGVLLSVFLIWFLTGILVYFAIERMIHQDFQLDSRSMLTVSIIGLFMNGLMWLVLSGCGGCCSRKSSSSILDEEDGHETSGHHHHHSHGHSQGHSHMNMNVRAAILHIIGDIIQSIGVLVASLIVHFYPRWKLADPICTLLFATLVFMTTFSIMKDSLHILMEGFPGEFCYEQVKQMLLMEIPEVRHVHSLHIWSLTHGQNALAVHLTIDDGRKDTEHILSIDGIDKIEIIRHQAEQLIRKRLSILQTTIQIELHDDQSINQCEDCQGPK